MSGSTDQRSDEGLSPATPAADDQADTLINIPYAPFNLRRALNAGHESIFKREAEDRKADLGLLRAGSASCISVDDGQFYGECPRMAHARLVGVERKTTQSRKLMFQAGEGNEDLWENVLVEGWAGRVLRRVRILQDHSFGRIKGSPDIILADYQDEWKCVLELKLLSATNSSCKREIEGSPDSKNLVQTATYAWLLGLPAILCYTSRTDFAIEFSRKKYGRNKLEPFYRLFYVAIKNGRVYYRDEFSQTEVRTNITVGGLRAAYAEIASVQHTKRLPPRPSSAHVDGSPPGYDRCDYCWLQPVCDQHEGNYEDWMDNARLTSLEVEG